MTKVLFICLGNICRSPLAHLYFQDLVEKRGLSDQIEADSAATSSEELGNPVHPGSRRILERLGIDCSAKFARKLTKADYEQFDCLIGMDRANLRSMERLFGGDPAHKLSLLLDHTARKGQEVADPWYTGDFEATYRDVKEGCEALLEELLR